MQEEQRKVRQGHGTGCIAFVANKKQNRQGAGKGKEYKYKTAILGTGGASLVREEKGRQRREKGKRIQ